MNYRLIASELLALALVAGPARAADTYRLDPAHTTIGFSVSHLVINTVHGRFKDVTGTVTLDPQNHNRLTEARGVIQAASIDTGIAKRDEHLRSPDFFDAAKYPTLGFETKRIEVKDGQMTAVGTFTMHGVTKEILLPFTVKGPIKDPWGGTRVGIEAHALLDRKDYGLTWNKVLEAGGVMVGDEVRIEINAEAVKVEPAAK